MLHRIKCWPKYFQPLQIGQKTFEVRINDRDYQVGDSLDIREWSPITESYTERYVVKLITYMIQGVCGLPENVCVMQLR